MISSEKNHFTYHNSHFTCPDYDTNKITISFPEYYLTGSTQKPTQKPQLPEGEYKILIYQTSTASTPLIQKPINLIQMPFNLTFYHHDHLGTTRYITNENGEILHTTDTLAYGEELTAPYENDKDEVLNTITYTGHEKDYETDLTYMLARYYSQGYGRFLSPDPGYDYDQLDPMSWNLYSYVRGNPIKSLDNNGEEKINFLINIHSEHSRDPYAVKLTRLIKLFEKSMIEQFGVKNVFVSNDVSFADFQKALFSSDSEFVFIHAHGVYTEKGGIKLWLIQLSDGYIAYTDKGDFYFFKDKSPMKSISLDKLSKKLRLILITSCYFNQELFEQILKSENPNIKVKGFSKPNKRVKAKEVFKSLKNLFHFSKDKGKSIQIILVRDKDGLHFEAVER